RPVFLAQALGVAADRILVWDAHRRRLLYGPLGHASLAAIREHGRQPRPPPSSVDRPVRLSVRGHGGRFRDYSLDLHEVPADADRDRLTGARPADSELRPPPLEEPLRELLGKSALPLRRLRATVLRAPLESEWPLPGPLPRMSKHGSQGTWRGSW